MKKPGQMTVSRRALLTMLLQGLGAGFVGLRSGPLVEAGQAYTAGSQTGMLHAHVSRPFNAETSVREFTSWLTPNERFFVRSHFGPPSPELIDPESWRLTVTGLVARELKLSLADLKEFRPVTITAVLQCSGNGRSFYRPSVPGVQWWRGAVGNAEWTCVRLRDVLERAGCGARCRHVQFHGADRPALPSVPLFIRSIPL